MRTPERGESSTGIVAVFAILLMVVIAGFIAWRAGMFGDGDSHRMSHEINVNTPSSN